MPSTVQPFYVWEMAEPGEWCWACEGWTAAHVPILTAADGEPCGVVWLRACDGCGSRTILR